MGLDSHLTESGRASARHWPHPEDPQRGELAADEGLAQRQGRVDRPLVGNQGGHVGHSDGDGGVDIPVLLLVLVSDSQVGEDDHEGEEELQTKLRHSNVLVAGYVRRAE